MQIREEIYGDSAFQQWRHCILRCIRYHCVVDKFGVLVSSWSAVSNNFYHHKPYETESSTSCKAYYNETRLFVG